MEVLSPRNTGATLVANIIDRGSISAQQLTVIALCLLCNMLDGFDITAMAVAVNAIGGEMSLREDKLGLLFSFALAGMMLGAMFLASVSDVIGRRKVMIASMAAIGISVLLTGYADNLWQLIGLRFLSGLGAGSHAGEPGRSGLRVQFGKIPGPVGGRGNRRLSTGCHGHRTGSRPAAA
ncbi:MFS transporter [Microbulbifer rhizosphaerae]|uniref:MFS family permease n=1 Tax=Microbulbifer rhizosphaerae TaxID=1562603 RepID=A0A7W4W854_9GAMM|nr:MFS transporter [Microbulbifer rhizosphaerae]MBB3059477.1 MFS family permease [Microbulbifer rhizosphaerae]